MGYILRWFTHRYRLPHLRQYSPLPAIVINPPSPQYTATHRQHNREVSYSSLLDLSITSRQQRLYDKHGLDIEHWTELGTSSRLLTSFSAHPPRPSIHTQREEIAQLTPQWQKPKRYAKRSPA